MKNDFESFYSSIDQTNIRQQWEADKNRRKKKRIIALIVILIMDLIIGYIFREYIMANFLTMDSLKVGIMQKIVYALIVIFVNIATYFLIVGGVSKEYTYLFKGEVIKKLLETFFNDVFYAPEKSMSSYIYDEGKYNEYYNRYYSDDYLEATIDNKYKINMAEIKTEKEETTRDANGNETTTTVTLFSGLFAKIDIGKSINSNLRITPNSFLKGKDKLEMDSQEFEKIFNVNATNKIIGMQLLTHDIMDLLINFRSTLNKKFDIYIENSTMYIRLHVGPQFEAKLNKNTAIDEEAVHKYYNIVDFIHSLSKEMIKVVENTEI